MIIKCLEFLKRLLSKFNKNECLYIHSSNALPAPLDSDKEKELLELVESGDIEARNTLIIHNLRLVVFIAKKFEST